MAGWTCAGCTTTYAVGAAKCPQCGSTERTDGRGGAVLPSLTVACGTGGCRHVGRERRVHLRTAAPGVLELPRLVCAGCGFDMPTVAPWPPVNELESDMPKISRHGGPSNRADIVEPSTEDTSEDAAPKANPAAPKEAAEAAPEEPAVKAPPRRRTRSRS